MERCKDFSYSEDLFGDVTYSDSVYGREFDEVWPLLLLLVLDF